MSIRKTEFKKPETINTQADFLQEDPVFTIKRADTTYEVRRPEAEDLIKKQRQEPKKAQPASIDEVKEKAKEIPVVMPEAPIQKTQKEKLIEDIKTSHQTLEETEERIYGKNAGELKKTRLADLDESDLEKRAEEAQKRMALSKNLIRVEEKAKKPYVRSHAALSPEELKKKIKAFYDISEKAENVEKDDTFVKNLAENYALCDIADNMKRWIAEASEGGYLPKDANLVEIEKRIARFSQLKQFLDAQSALMKNPYYCYLKDEDVSYTSKQLDEIFESTKDDTLKDYLTHLKTLRSLSFSRKKGLKSTTETAEQMAKREVELLSTKAEKRGILERLSDEALHFHSQERFTDPNYERKFTRAVFEKALIHFDALKITDLHFKNLKDMTDNFAANKEYFTQAREMEQLLAWAVSHKMSPPDEQLIPLRAKIAAFTRLEELAHTMQHTVVCAKDIDNITIGELVSEAESLCQDHAQKGGYGEVPRLGLDLFKFEKAIRKSYQKEHKNRKATIRKMYGFTHPIVVKKKTEIHRKGKAPETRETDIYEPGTISEEELQKRSREYQQNAVLMDRLRGMESYSNFVHLQQVDSLVRAYGRQKDLKGFFQLGRVLNAHSHGKSAEQIKRMIDIQVLGSDAEKEKMWKQIVQECTHLNLNDFDTNDPALFMQSIDYKMRTGNMLANLDDANKYIRDKEEQKRIKALYNLGVANGQGVSSVAQGVSMKTYGISLKDWMTPNFDAMTNLWVQTQGEQNALSQTLTEEKNKKGQRVSFANSVEFREIANFMTRMIAIGKASASATGKYGGVRQSPSTTRYEEYKEQGLIRETTPAEQKALSDFLTDFYAAQKEKEEALFAKLDESKNKIASRKHVIGHMATLYGEDEAKSLERYQKLYAISHDETDPRKLSDKREQIEEMIQTVMSFDLKELNFSSYREFYEDPIRFATCHAVTQMGKELDSFLDEYSRLMQNPAAGCRLDEDMLKEVFARCDLLKTAGPLFDEDFQILVSSEKAEGEEDLSLEEILHMPNAELTRRMNEAVAKRDAKQIDRWMKAMTISETMEGFDMGKDIRDFAEHYRNAKGVSGENSPLSVLRTLNGEKSVLDGIPITGTMYRYPTSAAFLRSFAENAETRQLSVSEREAFVKSDKKDPFLYHKSLVAQTLKKNKNQTAEKLFSALNKMDVHQRIKIGDERAFDLSAFMTGEKAADEKLLAEYTDEATREKALDAMTRDLMQLDLNIHIENDTHFAQNAAKLEEISRKARAYDRLLKANPKYKERLEIRRPGSKRSDFSIVEGRLGDMFLLSDYYRAKSLLLTNSYYRLHYNDELSANADSAPSAEAKEAFELIRLVARMTKRLEGNAYETRNEAETEALLDSLEQKAQQNAYVTGRPDLLKARPSEAAKAHKQLRKYFRKGNAEKDEDGEEVPVEDDEGIMLPALKKKEHYLEDAAEYETEVVKNYMDGARVKFAISKNKMDKLFSKRQKEVKARLTDCLSYEEEEKDEKTGKTVKVKKLFGSFDFYDSDTENNWYFNTVPARIINNFATTYANDLPVEELADICEGLVFAKKHKLDKNDKEAMAYAKQRWLSSAKKLFYLEYNAVRRLEKTYGTLLDQLPTGCFFTSLGAGQKDYHQRVNLTQDVTEFVGERLCENKAGENFSMADALVKEGLIKQEEADECRAVITHYYQNGHFVASGYHSAPVSRFQQDETYDSTQTVLNEQTTARTNFTFEGPKLSVAEERAFWKEAIGKNDAILTGGAETVSFKKERLGIYAKAQREALRKEREESGAAFSRYRGALSAKKKELQAQMKNALPGASEEAIKQLSAFHPALVSDKKEGTKQREEEFYALAKDILGMAQNAAPEEIAARKKAAIKTLLDRMKGDYPKGAKAWNVSDMVEDNVRKQPEKILYSGKLWANELLHNRILALQDLATGEEAKERFDKESYQDLRDMVLRDIPYAIYRKVLRSDWYQKLQDVGCRYQSLAEKRWEKLLSDANDVNNSRTLELDNGYMNEERYKRFGEFGIRVERPLRFEEEKKEEVSTEEAQEKVSEKVSEEKISEKAPEEKAAEKVSEEKVQLQKEEQKVEQPAHANPEMILRDGVEVPKLYIDANDPELIKTLADEKKVYRKEDYPQNQKAFYEQILRDNNAGVPIDFYDITIHRSPFMEEKFYRAMDSNGIEVERSNYFWKQDVAREVKEAYDWLYGYHRSHKDDVKEPEPIRYRKKINAPEKAGHIPYESQGRSRYCWACTMSGLMNDYAGRKVSDLAMIKNQPLAIPSFEESGFTNRRAYDRGKALIEGMYEGTANGNPAIFGDYIVDKLPNTAVFTANIGRIQGQLDLCKRRFLETLSTRLEHGPVGLLYAGHFVTVYGLDGDKLMVRDSMAKNPDKVAAYEHTAASIFSQAGTQVELVWLENIENREAEIAQKYHLDYNPEQREFSGNINREKETILHRNGIEGTTGFTLGDVVSQQVYVPKRMQVGAPAGGEQEVPPQQQAGEQQVQQPRQQEVVEQKQEPLQQEKQTEEIKEAQKQTGIKKELPKVGSFKSITNLTTQLSRLNAPELKRAFNMNSFEMKLIKTWTTQLSLLLNTSVEKMGLESVRYDALAALEELKKACVGYKKTYIRDEKNDPSPRHQGVLGILNNIDPMIEFLGGVSEEEFSSITKTGNKNQTLLDVLSSRKLLSAQDPAVRAKVATQRMRHAHNSRLSRILGMLADTNSSLSDSRALYGRINGMLKSPVARNQKDLEEAKEQILGRYDQLLADIRRYIDDRKSGSLKKVYRIAQVREMAAILQKERAAVAKISVKTLAESGASEASWLQLMLGGETILQETMKDGKAVFEPDDGRIGYAHTTDEVHWKNHAANSALHFLGADMSAYRTYEVVKTQKLDGTQGKALMYRDRTVVVRSINDSLALQWRDANFLYKAATDLKLNIQYSETALKKLGHIQIMDAIFGKTKRSRNSLRYAAKTQIVRGEPTLMICDVLSLENNGFFPEDDAPEAVSDIVDEKGALSLPVYDRELADRLMSLSPEECIKRFEADGIALSDKQKQGFRTRFLQIQNAFIKDRDDLENGWRNRLEKYEENRRKREIEEAEKQIKGFRMVGLGDKHPYIVEQQKIIDELSENKHLDPPEMYNYSYSYQKRTGGKLGLVIPEFFESIKRGDEVVEADEKTKNTNRFRRANAVREKVQKINALRQKTGFADSKRQSSKQQLLDMTAADQKDEAAFANKSEEFKEIVGLFAEYAQANVVGADGIAEGKNIYYARGSARYTGEVVDREAALLKNMLTKTRERLAKIPEDTADGALLAERMRLLEYLNRAETIAQGTLAIKADKDTVQKEVKDDRFVSIEYDDATSTVKKKEAYTWISKKDEPLFAHEPSPNDVVQGSLGNCYFLATMSAIAEQNPDFIKGMMKDNGDTVTVRFYENGKPLYVTVEKTVPAERADRAEETKSAFRYGRGSLWIQMLEKAFVASGLMKYVNEWDKVEDELEDKKRFHKKTFTEELEKSNEVTYDTIASGSSRLLARLITGKDGTGKAFGDHHVVKDMYKPEGIILDEDEQEFLQLARNMKNDRSYTLTVGSSDSFYVGEGTGLREGSSARGIYKHHAYTVLGIERVNDEDMVALRNPWGAGSSEAVYNETTGAITFRETVSDRAGGTLVIPVPMMLRLFNSYSKINL